MNPSELFRALLSVGTVSLSAVVLFGTTPARALTISLPFDGTCSWSSSSQTLTCTANSQTPSNPGAPVCSLAANNTTLPAGGGSVALTATCTNQPTSFSWSASPSTTFSAGLSTTSNGNSATISTSTNFTVTATNGFGSGQASRSVQVGGVVGGLTCPGFAKTILVNWDWASPLSRIDTFVTQLGLGTNGILVVPFTPTGPADNVLVALSAANYPAGNMYITKRIAISTAPCDLNPSAPASAISSATPSLSYVVGTSPVSGITGKPVAASLTPGVQYYINIANRSGVSNADPDGTPSCAPGGSFYPNCELRLSLQKPSGH